MSDTRNVRHRGAFLAYSLVELLCVIAIIAIGAALVLPSLKKGQAQVRRVQCISNLHQVGLGFQGFAAQHDDKYPVQVSTNGGGALEFVQAAYHLGGEFYFSHRYFLPLRSDLPTPKPLACPADTRVAATSFSTFHNGNLSYFATANPQFGAADSVIAGDRNVGPTYNSIARLGSYLYLKWTQEMHRYKGNVLFGDGHVEQSNHILRLSNAPPNEVSILLLPNTPRSPSLEPTLPTPRAASPAGPPSQALEPSTRTGMATVRINSTNSSAPSNVVLITSGPHTMPTWFWYPPPQGAAPQPATVATSPRREQLARPAGASSNALKASTSSRPLSDPGFLPPGDTQVGFTPPAVPVQLPPDLPSPPNEDGTSWWWLVLLVGLLVVVVELLRRERARSPQRRSLLSKPSVDASRWQPARK